MLRKACEWRGILGRPVIKRRRLQTRNEVIQRTGTKDIAVSEVDTVNEVYEYMKKQYEEHRHIPDIDELTHKFRHLPWVEINDAINECDGWQTEWVGSFSEGEGA